MWSREWKGGVPPFSLTAHLLESGLSHLFLTRQREQRMQLVSFSVSKYRSIIKTAKLLCHGSTILIGPNNEGKSNILRALVNSLELLSRFSGQRSHRGRFRNSELYQEFYAWHQDFPLALQEKEPAGQTIVGLEWKLSDTEVEEFQEEVKSSINGTLPLEIYFTKGAFGFKVLKRGPGGKTLSTKVEAISHFVAKRVNLSHIPAVRTSKSAHDIVTELLERELAEAEKSDSFRKALEAVAQIQQPILDKISQSITETLKVFLPNVKAVTVSLSEEDRLRALRRGCEIRVDDGTLTHLRRKGDGVQSLAALSLMKHASESGSSGKILILAIEEPESHLHPKAIHELRKVVLEITKKHQVIMTTHCPLFVDRVNLKSNIIVFNNQANPAKNIKEIRNVLGVRASDNLQHAEVALVVEGETDRRALKALLAHYSTKLKTALSEKSLGIESLHGGSNLPYKLSQIREAMCLSHSFLDHDKAGLAAATKAEQEGLLATTDVTFAVCTGMDESEIEDLINVELYKGRIFNSYGVSLDSPKFKGNFKWSERMKSTFKHQGKTWSDSVEMKLKSDIAELVEASPERSLNSHRQSVMDALVLALEMKLSNAMVS